VTIKTRWKFEKENFSSIPFIQLFL
jgi:hypothetical protein